MYLFINVRKYIVRYLILCLLHFITFIHFKIYLNVNLSLIILYMGYYQLKSPVQWNMFKT